MRGKEMGDIGMLKEDLFAWLLWQGGVIEDVVILIRINVILGVYRRRRGGRNSKYGANKASQNITRQNAVPGVT